MGKKQIREKFRTDVYSRDKYTCKVCGTAYKEEESNKLNAHHITDRTEMPNGGYVKENGITVCEDECHLMVELFHISNGEEWHEGLHPDDLYRLIGSNKELAIQKSEKL